MGKKMGKPKIAEWHLRHKDDAGYRAARAAGSRRHLEQVYRDAELGRMAREFLAGLGEALARIGVLGAAGSKVAAKNRRAQDRKAGWTDAAKGRGARKRKGA